MNLLPYDLPGAKPNRKKAFLLGDAVPKPLGFSAILPSHGCSETQNKTGDKRLLIPGLGWFGLVWPRSRRSGRTPALPYSPPRSTTV